MRQLILGVLVGFLLWGVLPTQADHGGLGNHPNAYCTSPSVATEIGFVHDPTDGTRKVIYVCTNPNGTLGTVT